MGKETKIGWMVVVVCPCSPEDQIAFTQVEMDDADVGHCPACEKPLIMMKDGNAYEVGKMILRGKGGTVI